MRAPPALLLAMPAALLLALPAHAQLDPVERRLLQLGWDQPLSGAGPVAGYAFFYLSRPQGLGRRRSLRLALAPVFADGELGFKGALGERTDVGLGLAGGGFVFGHAELRGGIERDEQSFQGHGASLALSVYHRLNPGGAVPLSAVARATAQFLAFSQARDTDAAFALPGDHWAGTARAGLRWGGQEPILNNARALELSAWYELRRRAQAQVFGFARDRALSRTGHFYWGRALFAYRAPDPGADFSAALTGGGSAGADRLTAYGLGGALPLATEFPLLLPGYFHQELSARRFALLDGRYGRPLPWRRLRLRAGGLGAAGVVDYLPELGQRGSAHAGLGGYLRWDSSDRGWRAVLALMHGFGALRDGRRGSRSLSLMVQHDLRAPLGGSSRGEAQPDGPRRRDAPIFRSR